MPDSSSREHGSSIRQNNDDDDVVIHKSRPPDDDHDRDCSSSPLQDVVGVGVVEKSNSQKNNVRVRFPVSVKDEEDDEEEEKQHSKSWRMAIGSKSSEFSDAVNANLIAARYGVFACTTLLVAYGVSQTPLFFRYKSVADIPRDYFVRRKCIRGRLVQVAKAKTKTTTTATTGNKQQQHNNKSILCYIRHLSPMERLLSKSWFDWFMKVHPSSNIVVTPETFSPTSNTVVVPRDVLCMEMKGIQAPPPNTSNGVSLSSLSSSSSSISQSWDDDNDDDGDDDTNNLSWLQRLAKERTVVTCQLLARRVKQREDVSTVIKKQHGDGVVTNNTKTPKRPIPGLVDDDVDNNNFWNDNNTETQRRIASCSNEYDEQQVAVCRMYYRPNALQFFSTDVALHMVEQGFANVASLSSSTTPAADDDDSYYSNNSKSSSWVVRDSTESLRDIQQDVTYLQRLHTAEVQAASQYRGIWSNPSIRQRHQFTDVVQEAHFQTTATTWQKVWRWIRDRYF